MADLTKAKATLWTTAFVMNKLFMAVMNSSGLLRTFGILYGIILLLTLSIFIGWLVVLRSRRRRRIPRDSQLVGMNPINTNTNGHPASESHSMFRPIASDPGQLSTQDWQQGHGQQHRHQPHPSHQRSHSGPQETPTVFYIDEPPPRYPGTGVSAGQQARPKKRKAPPPPYPNEPGQAHQSTGQTQADRGKPRNKDASKVNAKDTRGGGQARYKVKEKEEIAREINAKPVKEDWSEEIRQRRREAEATSGSKENEKKKDKDRKTEHKDTKTEHKDTKTEPKSKDAGGAKKQTRDEAKPTAEKEERAGAPSTYTELILKAEITPYTSLTQIETTNLPQDVPSANRQEIQTNQQQASEPQRRELPPTPPQQDEVDDTIYYEITESDAPDTGPDGRAEYRSGHYANDYLPLEPGTDHEYGNDYLAATPGQTGEDEEGYLVPVTP